MHLQVRQQRGTKYHTFLQEYAGSEHNLVKLSYLLLCLLSTFVDFDSPGPSTFMPVSRIQSRCAIAYDTIEFDYGEESIVIVSPLRRILSL